MIKKSIDLNRVSDEELLESRINDLPVRIKDAWFEDCIGQLYKELEDKGIVFRPQCYLADEWLTPLRETCIGIPFYLAHPTLIQLERKFMMEAEGETKDSCMQLLRHETGHAICYAYKFYKRKRWQRLFGPSSQHYADTYKYRPYSKNYVRHLDGYYAQYHPDEDFVETFAVWLTPGLDWKTRYQGWNAIHKLNYVDRLMKEIQGVEPLVKSTRKYWRLSTLRISLKNYYKKKKHYWAEEFPDFHDPFLRKVFVERNEQNKNQVLASDLIRKNRRNIINSISKYSGEKKYVIDDLLKDVGKRARELKLVSPEDEAKSALNLTAYITSLIMNYLYTGKFSGGKDKRKKK